MESECTRLPFLLPPRLGVGLTLKKKETLHWLAWRESIHTLEGANEVFGLCTPLSPYGTVQYSIAWDCTISTEPKYDSNSAAPPLLKGVNSIPTVGIARDPTGFYRDPYEFLLVDRRMQYRHTCMADGGYST
jgi:hypothetical protein